MTRIPQKNRQWLQIFFVDVPSKFDSWFRKSNFYFHRGYGGLLEKLPRKGSNTYGHSPIALLLPVLALYFLVYGPTLAWRGMPALAMLLMAVFVLTLLARWLHENKLFLIQWLVFTITSLSIWYLLPGMDGQEHTEKLYKHGLIPVVSDKERDPILYYHGLVPVVLILISITALIARILAYTLLKPLQKLEENDATAFFRKRLQHTELFVKLQPPNEVDIWKVLRALLVVPLYHPLQLLFPAAIVMFWFDDRDIMKIVTYWILGFTWFLLWLAGLHNRFQAMFTIMKRFLFLGGQLIVSLVIILLAVGRYMDFGYISTLVESTPWYVLFFYFFSAYSLFWLYEYWINRALTEQLLPLLAQPECSGESAPIEGWLKTLWHYILNVFGISSHLKPGQVPYKVANDDVISTDVLREGRVLQIHAGACFVAIGRYWDKDEKIHKTGFQLYEKLDLFHRVVHESLDADSNADIQVQRCVENSKLSELQKRVRFYFVFLNAFLVLTALGAWLWQKNLDQIPSESVTALTTESAPTHLVDLQNMIFSPDDNNTSDDVLLVAASGGGTRAALYTTAVLRGLAEMDVLRDVSLVSGVSGGGAALSYFTTHRKRLLDKTSAAYDTSWRCYHDTMADPFIQDVLEGVLEWRIMSGYRLGVLLGESFQHRFYQEDCPTTEDKYKRLGGFNEKAEERIAFIFNTALAGHPYYDSHRFAQKGSAKNVDSKHHSSDISSGGRLIFTNLLDVDGFPQKQAGKDNTMQIYNPMGQLAKQAPDEFLKYVVVRNADTRLTTAAALNANFPPIFSNAAVDIHSSGQPTRVDRYWVTDGGATDNRGLVSLLYALRNVLEKQCAQSCPRKDEKMVTPHDLPRLHILVAEASASSFDYSQDRGIATKFGAAENFANQLIYELLAEVTRLYQRLGGKKDGVQIHYLEMPSIFRVRGGMGTHWMLQDTVKFVNTGTPDADKAKEDAVRLNGDIVRQVIDVLFMPKRNRDEIKASQRQKQKLNIIWPWIDADDHDDTWRKLCEDLQQRRPKLVCTDY